jgi:hypothetical protein
MGPKIQSNGYNGEMMSLPGGRGVGSMSSPLYNAAKLMLPQS